MIDYKEYLKEKLNESIAYSEYVAQQIDKNISFTEYLSGMYDTKNFKRKIKIKNLFN
jgi:hypothetical protein